MIEYGDYPAIIFYCRSPCHDWADVCSKNKCCRLPCHQWYFFERMQITLPSLIFCDQMRIILPLFGALWALICMLTLQWVKTLHMLWTKCGIALPSLICYEWNVDCPAIIDMLWPKCRLPSQHWHVVNEWGLTCHHCYVVNECGLLCHHGCPFNK